MTRAPVYTKHWNLDDEDQTEVVIEYSATPGTPEKGNICGPVESCDPGSDDEFDIVSVKTLSGVDVPLTDAEEKAAYAVVESYHEWENEADAAAWYDLCRDDRMTGDA